MESRTKSLQYYYANTEHVVKRQQTDEYRARQRELYKERATNMMEEGDEAKLVYARALAKERESRAKSLQYYYDHKDAVVKRQQTDEYRARQRELYKERTANMTEQEHEEKLVRARALAKERRKRMKEELKAKYPGLKLYQAKALEKIKYTGLS
jgi:hypothetical protein